MPEKRHHRRNYNDIGHAHELTFSCYQGLKFLQSERTCQWLAESIEQARAKSRFDLWAYVFMPEHVHLILCPSDHLYDIAKIRRAIKAPVARKAIRAMRTESPEWLARITRQRGQKTERLFWQSGGGFDRNVVEPATLGKMIDYIHMNPVRKGLVDRPEAWKWSSAASFIGLGKSPILPDRVPTEWAS